MGEYRFGNIPIKKDRPEIKTPSKPEISNKPKFKTLPRPEPLTRREFIKNAILGTAGVLVSSSVVSNIDKFFPESEKQDAERLADKIELSPEVEELRQQLLQETKEQADIQDIDTKIIGKTLEKQIETQDRIELDRGTKQAIYQNWRKEYAPGGYSYNKSLLAGIERMRPWMEDMRKVFRKNGVPEKYIFLAIAESHFKFEAVSHKEAVGAFQVMSGTAKLYDMIVSPHYDERLDPVKSAELCAKHLRDSFEMLGHDWSLALMDYNGGYTKKYLKYVQEREHSEELTFKDKNRLSENTKKVEDALEDIVRPGDTLEDFAKKYGTSVTLLLRANPKIHKPENLPANSRIKIPHKRKISLGDFNQWLERRINAEIRQTLKNTPYIVKPGEKLRTIAEKHKIDYGLLRTVNPNVTETNIKSGQSIHIPARYKHNKKALMQILSGYNENINYPEKFNAIYDIIEEQGLIPKSKTAEKTRNIKIKKPATLLTIAQENNVKISTLKDMNPAIRSIKKKLPYHAEVRLPEAQQRG